MAEKKLTEEQMEEIEDKIKDFRKRIKSQSANRHGETRDPNLSARQQPINRREVQYIEEFKKKKEKAKQLL